MSLVSDKTKTDVLVGDGANDLWDFEFLVNETAEFGLQSLDTLTGAITDLVDWTLQPGYAGNKSGGKVKYPNSGAAIPATTKLVGYRKPTQKQQTELTKGNVGNWAAVELRFDEAWKNILDINEELDRSVRVPRFATSFDPMLPMPEADKLLATKLDGSGWQFVSTLNGVIAPGDLDTTGATLHDKIQFNGVNWAYQGGLDFEDGDGLTFHTTLGNDATIKTTGEVLDIEGHLGGFLGVAGTRLVNWGGGLLSPDVDGAAGLGSTSKRWASLFAQAAQVRAANPTLTLHDTASADAATLQYLGASNALRLQTPGAGDSISLRPGNGAADAALFDGNLDTWLYGDLDVTLGNVSTIRAYTNNGTAALPVYTFTTDPDTGMYRSAADILGFSTGGTVRALLSSASLTAYSKLLMHANVADYNIAINPNNAWAGALANANARHFVIQHDTAQVGMTIAARNTGNCNLYFGDTDNTVQGRIAYFNATDEFQIQTGNGAGTSVHALTIDNLQDMYIPNGFLDVALGIMSGDGTYAGALSAWNLADSVQHVSVDYARFIAYGSSATTGASAASAFVAIDANKPANERVLYFGIGGTNFPYHGGISAGNDNGTVRTLIGFDLDSAGNDIIYMHEATTFEDAVITMSALPTSSPGGSGRLWNDGGTLKIT